MTYYLEVYSGKSIFVISVNNLSRPELLACKYLRLLPDAEYTRKGNINLYKRYSVYTLEYTQIYYYIPFEYDIDIFSIKDPVLLMIHLEYIKELLEEKYLLIKLKLNPENEV